MKKNETKTTELVVEKISEKDMLEKVNDVEEALSKIKGRLNDGKTTDIWMMTFLCRVGELRGAIKFNQDLKKNGTAIFEHNELCHCYDKSEYDY